MQVHPYVGHQARDQLFFHFGKVDRPDELREIDTQGAKAISSTCLLALASLAIGSIISVRSLILSPCCGLVRSYSVCLLGWVRLEDNLWGRVILQQCR